MKNVLVYDQLSIPDAELFVFEEWNFDIVGSISEAINHPFLREQATKPLLFVIHAAAQTSELAEFIVYIKKHWPALSILLIPDDQRERATWGGLLHSIGIEHTEKPVIHENSLAPLISTYLFTQNHT
jgi:hypothetical protein